MQKKVVNKKRIALVVSSPSTAKIFLSHQISTLSDTYDVTLVANFGDNLKTGDELSWLCESICVKNIPINREIKLLHDIKALFMLYFYIKNNNFSLVHSFTPKAGLLSMISSWTARVPVRIHSFTGQVWATRHGFSKFFLKSLDRVVSKLETSILIDSHSQQKFLLKNRVLPLYKSKVLGNGSISGVDINRFKVNYEIRKNLRLKFGVDDTSIIILFLGRIKKEKGVPELINAFSRMKATNKRVILWLVGMDEDGLQHDLHAPENVFWIPHTDVPEQYMAAADIFCLPSYREGFGSVVIEAAACGIPSIGSDIYGLNDAIVDKVTGILVPVKSVKYLNIAMQKLVDNKAMRERMGGVAKSRAIKEFSQSKVTELLMQHYRSLL